MPLEDLEGLESRSGLPHASSTPSRRKEGPGRLQASAGGDLSFDGLGQ